MISKTKLYQFSCQIKTLFRTKYDFYDKKSTDLPSVKQCCAGQSFFPFMLKTSPFQVRNIVVPIAFSAILTNSLG
jgi:hypothetical protein